MKIYLAIISFVLLATQPLSAINDMILEGGSVEASDTITIQIKISNDDAFVAFQSDIVLPGAFQYIENSAILNAQRAADHQLSARMIGQDTLRLFGYSTSNSAFSGNSGTVASFKLKAGTVPGDYSLTLSEALIGDTASNNILTSQQTNPVTLLAPDITLSKDSLDFGEIPLQDSGSQQVIIQNTGNQTLEVTDINTSNPHYSADETTFSIQPGSQHLLTVQYSATEEEDAVSTISINSNDPDEASREIKARVYAFAVNELHTGTFTAFSGDQATLSFSINNMEPFTGFQFDMMLPEVLQYVAGSARLSERSNDHSVSANQVSENELRVVSYSPSNEAFEANSGEVVYLDFHVNGTGGSYWLNLNEVIIGDSTGENIVSDIYNNYINIAAPDIQGKNKLDFGEVAITDQPVQQYNLENTGEDTLIITEAYFTTGSISLQDTLPLEIAPHANHPLSVSFQPSSEGPFSETLRLRNNDPDEDPWTITIEGNVFMPNYMSVPHAVTRNNDTVDIRVEVDNYEPFVGFQFDLTFPDFATCLTDQIALTSRADNHDLQVSMIDANTVRAFAYSMDMNTFSGKEGPVITIPMVVNAPVKGVFDLSLSNALLGNENSEDILYQTSNGELAVADFKIGQVTQTPVQCYGTSTGEISIQAEGQTSSLSYSIDSGNTWSNSNRFTELNSGIYHIKIKDNDNGVILTYSENPVLLEQPEELVIDSLSLNDVTGCHGNANGSIAIAGSGGSGTLEYSIDDGLTWQTDSIFSSLISGEYTIAVRDTNLCTNHYINNPISITQPRQLIIDSIQVTPVSGNIGDSNGSIIIATSGGTGQISYSVDAGSTWQADSIFNGLPSGNYDVAVKDNKGCITHFANNPIYVAEPNELVISFLNVSHITGCYGEATGQIDIEATVGTGSLQYSIDGGTTWQSNSIFSGLTAGTYTIQVKDENGKITDYTNNPVVLTQPNELTIDSVNHEDISGCNGEANGQIAIASTGGSGEQDYSIDGGVTWHTDSLFTGLSEGEYEIVVRDQNGCMQTYQDNPIVISKPTPANISIAATPSTTVCGGEEIQLDATHPAAETYYWEPSGKTGSTITIDSSGIGYGTQHVKLTVTDTNDCSITEEIDIEFTNCTGIDNPGATEMLIYPNPASEKFTVEVSGYTGEMQISLYNAIGKLISKKDPIDIHGNMKSRIPVNGLSNGLYYVQVKCGRDVYVKKVFVH